MVFIIIGIYLLIGVIQIGPFWLAEYYGKGGIFKDPSMNFVLRLMVFLVEVIIWPLQWPRYWYYTIKLAKKNRPVHGEWFKVIAMNKDE